MSEFTAGAAKRWCATLLLTVALGLSGCATMQGYDSRVGATVQSAEAGSPAAALAELERNNTSEDKDLLYFLEKGELQRMSAAYEASRAALLEADARVQAWEDQVKSDPSKLMGEIGAFLINDTTRRYDGRDYEKVFLNVRIALNHLALGDWDAARTEIKKMHEREAIIAEFRAYELEEVKKAREEKGVQATSYKDLNGYPVETLDDPQVQALKNSYESAIANYLAGFVYEALGEPSLAAAGYRKAVEMRPGEAVLEESLAGLDERVSRVRAGNAGLVDTLIVVEAGSAPAITSKTLPLVLPVPGRHGVSMVATPISWPVIEPANLGVQPHSVRIGAHSQPLAPLTSVDLMARKALSDEMPGIILRSSVRAITRGAAQKAIQDNSRGLVGAFVSVAAGVVSIALEKADERTWRTLPGLYSVARVQLPPGTHQVSVDTPFGTQTREVLLTGPYAVVTLRVTSGALYLTQTPADPNALSAPQAAPVVPAAAPAPAAGAEAKVIRKPAPRRTPRSKQKAGT